LLTALQPRTIIEIGSEKGKTTQLLLTWCQQHDAVLHAIDPSPLFDVAAWQEQYGQRFVFHQTTSLRALSTLPPADVVFIDGDHNWYTVFQELKTIKAQSETQAGGFPVVLLHDIGWPYGRRDLYYAPETIPEQFRQPYARKGIRPGVKELQDKGGSHAQYCNATTEHTPRNGVLTAVEDFLKQTDYSLEWCVVPGFHGLGLLFPLSLRATHTAFDRVLAPWLLSPELRQYVGQLEANRVQQIVNCTNRTLGLRHALATTQRKLEQMQQKVERLTEQRKK
jgi:hypothetical protein